MPRYANDIEVLKAALGRIGEPSITSLTDGSAASVVAGANYEGVVGDYLERHAWTWATKTADLTLIGESDNASWTHEYALPEDCINVRFVTVSGFPLGEGDWALQGDVILTNAEADYQITYTYRAPESRWSYNFGEVVVTRMQGVLAAGLLERYQDADLMEKRAEAKLLKAITRDRRQSPGVRAQTNPLARIWTGRRGGDYRRSVRG